LRSLLRDRDARETDGVFVCEGPRVISAALDQRVPLIEVFVGADASAAAKAVAERADRADVDVRVLAPGVAAKVGATTTPQGVFGIAWRPRVGIAALSGVDLAVVAPLITDPGNAGTLIRSAAAAGASIIVLGPRSVDAYNPKVVRASAGACFAVQILEGVPAMEVMEALGDAGVRRVGAVASGGRAPEQVDLRVPTAIVVGHEAAGLDSDLPVDELVTIPMHATESMNVAMAGTVLLYEAARQRRTRS
jgi:TrmH family RNA methyltransferase